MAANFSKTFMCMQACVKANVKTRHAIYRSPARRPLPLQLPRREGEPGAHGDMAGAVEATLAGELGVGRGSGARCRERADGLAAALLVDAELAHLGTEATFDGSVRMFVRLGKVSKFPSLFLRGTLVLAVLASS